MPRTQNHIPTLGGSNRLLSLAEAAERLGKPAESLRKYRNIWGVPWLKVGRDLKFPEREIDAWISERVA